MPCSVSESRAQDRDKRAHRVLQADRAARSASQPRKPLLHRASGQRCPPCGMWSCWEVARVHQASRGPEGASMGRPSMPSACDLDCQGSLAVWSGHRWAVSINTFSWLPPTMAPSEPWPRPAQLARVPGAVWHGGRPGGGTGAGCWHGPGHPLQHPIHQRYDGAAQARPPVAAQRAEQRLHDRAGLQTGPRRPRLHSRPPVPLLRGRAGKPRDPGYRRDHRLSWRWVAWFWGGGWDGPHARAAAPRNLAGTAGRAHFSPFPFSPDATASFDPARTLAAVQAERCTSLLGVPTMFIRELELDK